jgi:hypothetical protein
MSEIMYLVDVTKYDLLDGVVFENLTNNAAIAATNNQDLFGVGVGCQRKMCDHLLIPGYSL